MKAKCSSTAPLCGGWDCGSCISCIFSSRYHIICQAVVCSYRVPDLELKLQMVIVLPHSCLLLHFGQWYPFFTLSSSEHASGNSDQDGRFVFYSSFPQHSLLCLQSFLAALWAISVRQIHHHSERARSRVLNTATGIALSISSHQEEGVIANLNSSHGACSPPSARTLCSWF